jgi:hypothetical protein
MIAQENAASHCPAGGAHNPKNHAPKHSEIAGKGNKNVAADVRLLRLDFICESSVIMSSLGVSIYEAAARGHDVTTGVHLRQLRSVLVSTIKTYRELVAPSNIDGAQ